MTVKLWIWLLLAAFPAGCGALASEISSDMGPQISTEVAIQVGTAIADLPAEDLPPAESELAMSDLSFDCEPKYCKDMSSCEEAVYQWIVCDIDRLDNDNDGVPCESICNSADVAAIRRRLAGAQPPAATMPVASPDETGPVTHVVDGDTIDVLLNGVNTRIRYLQMNTPERDHPCYRDATKANADLVTGKTVRLVPDKELVDRYDRLLRFVYVDDVLVNRVLVQQGWAEVVLYPPNDLHYDEFLLLEKEAAAAGRGCHPSGIFDDGSTTR